jgi:hypothetical protein
LSLQILRLMAELTDAADGKEVSIEGMLNMILRGVMRVDDGGSWFSLDSSLREGRSCSA